MNRLNPATDRVSMFACRARGGVQLGWVVYLDVEAKLMLQPSLACTTPLRDTYRRGSGAPSVTPSAPPIWIGGRIIRSR